MPGILCVGGTRGRQHGDWGPSNDALAPAKALCSGLASGVSKHVIRPNTPLHTSLCPQNLPLIILSGAAIYTLGASVCPYSPHIHMSLSILISTLQVVELVPPPAIRPS